jgi:hypothetical protein
MEDFSERVRTGRVVWLSVDVTCIEFPFPQEQK